MDGKSVDYRVKEIFADVLGHSGSINSEELIYHGLGVDSMDLVEICQEIESEFGFEPEDSDVEKWKTVGDVIRYVRRKLPVSFTQDDVDAIVARARELGAGAGLGTQHTKLSNYWEPRGPGVLAELIINLWPGKRDLVLATQALIEFLSEKKEA